jgi:hypothetical protein
LRADREGVRISCLPLAKGAARVARNPPPGSAAPRTAKTEQGSLLPVEIALLAAVTPEGFRRLEGAYAHRKPAVPDDRLPDEIGSIR